MNRGMPSYSPGVSLERATLSLDRDSDDATLWKGSLVAGGTPCLPYLLLGELLDLRITDWGTAPAHPTPADDVTVTVYL